MNSIKANKAMCKGSALGLNCKVDSGTRLLEKMKLRYLYNVLSRKPGLEPAFGLGIEAASLSRSSWQKWNVSSLRQRSRQAPIFEHGFLLRKYMSLKKKVCLDILQLLHNLGRNIFFQLTLQPTL